MDESALKRIIKSVLGFSDDGVLAVLKRGVRKGYDRKQYTEKLRDYVDSAASLKITEKVLTESHGETGRKKRKFVEHPESDGVPKEKRSKSAKESKRSPSPVTKADDQPEMQPVAAFVKPAAEPVPTNRIQDVMAAAKRAIEERKKSMAVGSLKPGEASQYMQDAMEKQQKMEELKARIAAKMPGILDGPASKPTLSKDQSPGETVRHHSPVPTTLTHRMPTLKANQRAEKRAEFELSLDIAKKEAVLPPEEALEVPTHFDSRIPSKGPTRKHRAFNFHEKGEIEKMANRIRAKAKLEKLQHEITSASKKTGISSAAKLALVVPAQEDEDVPDMEWWDQIILGDHSYGTELSSLDLSAITNLIEHPIQLAPTGYQPETDLVGIRTHLTQRERKKLRRQNRKEMQREFNEKVRLGLEPPPEPKVKISNLMRVLGTEAVQDPTKMEAHVREQMARRQKKHEEANMARKLTPGERKDKKKRKIFEDLSEGVHVAVYRINDLSNPSKKFKIETNAKQLYMTGTVVLHKEVNVVVVEGGPKQQKFFKNLMLQRIKWQEDTVHASKGSGEPNKCALVWEGLVKDRNFGEMKFKSCPLEKAAREHFQMHHVDHYWDLAFSGTVHEQSADFVAY